jgi:hypothetical protein
MNLLTGRLSWQSDRIWFRWQMVCLLGICLPVLPQGRADQGRRVRTYEPRVEGLAPKFRASHLHHLQRWVDAAEAALKQVRDYECTFVKQERIDGRLQDEHVALLRVRTEPFSVYLKFTAPRSVQGREVSFVAGRNEGKMRAKNGGALGVLGYVLIDPKDPRAMQGTRHAITEAGIANLLAQLKAACATMEKSPEKQPTIRTGETVWSEQPCVVFEIVDSGEADQNQVTRTVIAFDRNTNLPVYYEAWLKSGELLERFGYQAIRFNRGLTDASFP